MSQNFDAIFSKSAMRMKKSEIRECLKLTQRPGMISFAGGLPAPDTFPIEELRKISDEVLKNDGESALQYSKTEGDDKLRDLLTERYQKMGLKITRNNLIIVTSSQQSLDFLGRIFIDDGDEIICELPSYSGALGAFRCYGAKMTGILSDESGMRADILDSVLASMMRENRKPKFIYTIPDFQNPAGITMPESRRKEVVDIARKYGVLIVEDSPYRELRFSGVPQKTIHEIDGGENVITIGTFSKIFVPGFRTGWIIAPEAIIDKFVTAKQSADLCTASFVQKITAKYMELGFFDRNLLDIVVKYGEKKDIMLEGLRKYMPEGVSWTEPDGGLFLFLTLPPQMNADELFYKAVEKNVAFIKGSVFHCDGSGHNTMRLNFSYCTKEENIEGIKRLAEVIRENL